ncbi:phospholipase effector Tle1 domain-containing protein [Povalibacter sp.]|uniref:phospholipase effector Tle1 domain-containing protein n=1 Tax=Povalibacter sp. TaxID=1962978 RepID=UPI002F42E481
MERVACSLRHSSAHTRGRLGRPSRQCRQQGRVCRGRQRGAAIVEAVIALPILLAVILGAIQFGLIYQAKATLNFAGLQAARAGAVSNAQPEAIRGGLARGLAPLYSPDASVDGVVNTIARINASLLQDARIRILNPTREAFEDFAEEVDGVREIPNDRLHSRSTSVGTLSGMNIQDANLLRVEVTYGYELNVPLVNWFISRVLLSTRRAGSGMDAFQQQLLRRGRLPIVTTATVRMQSPARMSDAVMARGDLPEVDRIPADARPPDDTDEDEGDEDEEGRSSGSGDGGSNLGDGFLGFGGGSGDGSGGGSSPGGGSGGGGSGSGGGGGGNSGSPAECPGNGGDGSPFPSTPPPPGDSSPVPPRTDPFPFPALQSGGAEGATLPNIGLPSLSVGNPIHVVTGNKYQREVDLAALPGQLGLSFVRHYNSDAVGQAGVMGAGWRHGYEASVRASTDGGTLDLWQADGRRLRFVREDKSDRFPGQRASDGNVTQSETGYVWQWPSGRELDFDRSGRLTAIRERSRTIDFVYDADNRLERVVDPQRRELSFEYYANGRVARIRAAGEMSWRYFYDDSGNLSMVVSASGRARRYDYTDSRHPHHLTDLSAGDAKLAQYGGVNRFQTIAHWAYDTAGRGILSSHPDDAGKISLEYGDGYTDVTDAFGRVSRYVTQNRNEIALVTEVRGPGCGACGVGDARYEFDESFQLTMIAAKGVPSQRYGYDAQRRLVSVERERGSGYELATRYIYDADALRPASIELPSVKPAARHSIHMAYAPDGSVLSVRETGYSPTQQGDFSRIERTVRFHYDRSGVLSSINGPRSDVADITRIEYDQSGHITAVRSPTGNEVRLSEFDAAGRPRFISQTGSPSRRVDYDSEGRLTRVTDLRSGGERSTRYSYDVLGRLQEVIDADGRVQRIGYDAASRPDRFAIDDSGIAAALKYAPDGNVIGAAILMPGSIPPRLVRYVYDEQRRLLEVRDGEGPPLRQLAYVGESLQPFQITGPMGEATEFAYGVSGSIESILAPDGGITRFGHDRVGRLIDVVAPNGAGTSYSYDDFGRRVSEKSADSGVTYCSYDASGNLIERITGTGARSGYGYDADSRLVKVSRREGPTTLEYRSSQLTGIVSPDHKEHFDYDTEGRPVRHVREIAGRSFETTQTYNAHGRIETRTLPSGQRLRYHYTPTGSLRAITRESMLRTELIVGNLETGDGASAKPADAMGRLAYGNGLQLQNLYGAKTGYLQSRSLLGLAALSYEYDESGRMIAIKDGPEARSYEYDAMGRLTNARLPAGDFNYSYDTSGHRIAESRDTDRKAPSSLEYHPESNRLASNGLVDYDAAGHPVVLGNKRYDYNSDGRPIHLYVDGKLTATYRYNFSGERVSKTLHVDGRTQTTFYLYERHQLIAEADEKGKVTREYLYLGAHPVAILESGKTYWIHTDHLGTPHTVTDATRRIVWNAEYEPFGAAQVDDDPDADARSFTLNLRFPGQYADAESGTHYNIMRDYDPQTGRYLTPDPIGLYGGVNPYAYVHGNPVSGIDPLGLFLFSFDGTWINSDDGDSSNVRLFGQYYQDANGENSEFYRRGAGASIPDRNWFVDYADRIVGGLSGFGTSSRIDEALRRLDLLIDSAVQNPSAFDGTIDVVGFSRGAAAARAFANEVYRKLDRGDYDRMPACSPIRIRFIGLFDSVGSMGIPGNSTDVGFDFRIDTRVGYVAQAVALNEHRAFFDLSSIEADEHRSGSQSNRVEQGFIGAHSDIGGAYTDGDLSDIALQWMHAQARSAGVLLGDLSADHLAVNRPIIHDERLIRSSSFDREVFYPNDPDWRPESCTPPPGPRPPPNPCRNWVPPATQRQRTAPQFPDLSRLILENRGRDSIRGTVDMEGYLTWLRENGIL